MKGFRYKSKLCHMLFLVITAVLLSSCSNVDGYTKGREFFENDNPVAIAIIIGRHANAMAIPEDAYDSVKESLRNAVYGGYVCAIISDSTPTKVDLVDDGFFEETARNTTVLEHTIDERIETFVNSIRDVEITADSQENDLLAAIREAKTALSVSNIKDIADKRIVIIDTGISTTGDLNFLNMDFLRTKPDIDDIINQLRDYEGIGVLPDLTGINVTFIGTEDGLAEVANPQTAGTTDKRFIKDLWSKIAIASGAGTVQFESAAGWDTPNRYTEDTDSLFPYVSPVTFSHEPVIVMPEITDFDINNPDQQPDLPPPPVVDVRLGSEMIGFLPDRAEFLNEANAIQTLRPFAEELRKFFDIYSTEKIWIVGTTASTTKDGDGDIDLGLNRAEKVKHILVNEFGISADKLLTIGLGAKFPWHVDEFSDGSFNTEDAQDNRAVWLLANNADTDKFNQLKTAYENSDLLPAAQVRFSELIN